ncbi:MAG: glutamate formimidoyltransferase [Tannerella sp.]|nr:glutamate formimidoyltransferase [Tannerella sp.]
MERIVECIPNFSEGRDLEKINRIVDVFRRIENVKLLDYSNDKDHNRMVVTVVGEPMAVKDCIVEAVGVAIDHLDIRKHHGIHPRVGVADVIPFVPVRGMTIDETDELAKSCGKSLAIKYNLPIYFYEYSASAEHRRNLSAVRKGEYEGLNEKMQLPEWKPDEGPDKPHPSAGATIVGARNPLIAFNVNLQTNKFEVVDKIAKRIRHIGGGLRYCKAIGLELKEQGIMQVSMNLTDYTKTSIYQVVEMIRFEARRYGVEISGCELVGMVPLQAVVDTMSYYLSLEGFTAKQILDVQLH